jgi:hypothetical protein
MPFDEKDPKDFAPKTGLKQVAGPKSMFEGKPKPPTPQEHQQKVRVIEENKSEYKMRSVDLFTQFRKAMNDKTLQQNRSAFVTDTQKEMLKNMIQLGIDMNNDPNEPEDGNGSLTLIICLLTTCLEQRDRINDLEYAITTVQKKLESTALADYISKEITKALDKKKENG